MDSRQYRERLYPLQDRVLQRIGGLDTGFYLTGGTAASRGYLDHRYSDDLDLFVNDDARFGLWSARVIQGLAGDRSLRVEVQVKDERFTRLVVLEEDLPLKVELVNDVPSRVGVPTRHPVLGLLDTAENILANKVSALVDRNEPKDLADLWGFSCRMGLPLRAAIRDATGKAAGVFEPDLARVLCSVTRDDWEAVRWTVPPPYERYREDLVSLGELLVLEG